MPATSVVVLALLAGGCSSDDGQQDEPAPAAEAVRESTPQAKAERRAKAELQRKRAKARRQVEAKVDDGVGALERRVRPYRQEFLERRAAAEQRQRELERKAAAAPPAPTPTPKPARDDCHLSYQPCLDPNASDYDCEGEYDDGPKYTGQVIVIGPDEYGLDDDGDGAGCEPT